MNNNKFGNYFSVTTFGESHGSAIGVVVDGVPSGIPLELSDVQTLLDKRKPGGSYTSQRKESDQAEILSGIFEGKTLGTPIAILIRNVDHKSQDYEGIRHKFRPGHGDYTWQEKFGIRDYRGGGRSSARETASRVAGGAIALKILQHLGINIYGYLVQVGDLAAEPNNFNFAEINNNEFFAADSQIIPHWQKLINQLREEGDSIGAKVEIRATKVPVGLGEPVANKLDAELAKIIMSIPAVKGVEIGLGFATVHKKGSESNDEIVISESPNPPQSLKKHAINFKSNYAGGIQAGISNGNDIVIRFAVKAASSIKIPRQTITDSFQNTTISTTGRHDPCVGIRAVPVGIAMVAIVLLDNLLLHRARTNFLQH